MKRLFFILFALVAVNCFSQSTYSMLIYSSKQEINTSGTLGSSSPYPKYVVYSIFLTSVPAGSIILWNGNYEATVSSFAHQWGMGMGMTIGSSNHDSIGFNAASRIMPFDGTDQNTGALSSQVHQTIGNSGIYYVKSTLTNVYFNLIAYTYSSSASGQTATLGNGQLTLLLFKHP